MKAAKKWLTAMLIGVLFFSASTEVLAYQVLKTTTDLRLREGPSTATAILNTIPNQTPAEIFSTTGNWAKTEYLDQTGYAGLKYLAPIATTMMKKVTVSLRLRATPSLSGLILAVIPAHTPIPTFERSGDWIKTVWSGKVGWVSIHYVQSLDALPQMQTTVNLRLRSGPSTSYPILLVVPAKCVIPVLTTSSGWIKTWTGGKLGWMSQTYLKSFSLAALRPAAPPTSLLGYSNEKMEWSHTYPQDYHYGYPELDSHYRYDDGKVHLTIDCGYEFGLTAKFMDVLKAKNVKARFYTTGPFMRDNPDLVRRMLNEGHQVGNHTWSHPDTVDLMAESIQLVYDDLRRWEEQFKLTMGRYPDRWYYRPPSGIFSERTLGLTYWMGYTTELYQVALRDWDPLNQLTPEVTLLSLLSQTKPGSIILLHCVSSSDLKVLGTFIDQIRAKGWEFALP